MKSLLLSLTAFLSLTSFGQEIADKISNKANYVFSINGAPTLQQVAANDISASSLFKEMIDEFFRGHGEIHSLDQIGIDYSKRIFFAGEYSDDISINYMAYELKDVAQFEALVKGTEYETKYEEKDGLKVLAYDYDSKLYWNDKLAILISGYYAGQEYNDWGWYDNHEEIEQVYPPIEDMTEDQWKEYMEMKDKKREEERKKDEEEKRKKAQKREEFTENGLENRVKVFFSDELKNKGENLGLSLNKEANATFWYANYISFMDPFMYGMGGYNRHYYGGPFGFGGLFGMTNFFNGEMITDLYLEEDQIRMDGKMKYYGDIQKAYKKIFSQKINPSFTKMVSENDLGYISMSSNTEAFLEEYPNIIENMLTIYYSTYAEEYSLFGDLFAIAVDEEAISDLITGDVMFVFHDMGMKSVEYYSYDYDENYNYEKTLKTRTELVPDLSFIVGTNRQDIMNRFVKIGLKYELLEKIDGGYLFTESNREFPFKVYASVQDNFVIFSNSQNDIKAITSGNVADAISGGKKKDISKNANAVYFNIKEFMKELLLSDEVRGRDKEMFNLIKDDLTEARGTMHFEKDGSVFEATAPIPSNHENASIYLLHTIDKMINHTKKRN